VATRVARAAVSTTVAAAAPSAPVVRLVSVAALYLAYQRSSGRLAAERRNSHKTADLCLATIELLERAIEARDQTAPNHVPRVQAYATGLARAI
jgi:response regulator RpfG family c-di-GMP phosphodiesterase